MEGYSYRKSPVSNANHTTDNIKLVINMEAYGIYRTLFDLKT